jgi:hypothetical protein
MRLLPREGGTLPHHRSQPKPHHRRGGVLRQPDAVDRALQQGVDVIKLFFVVVEMCMPAKLCQPCLHIFVKDSSSGAIVVHSGRL